MYNRTRRVATRSLSSDSDTYGVSGSLGGGGGGGVGTVGLGVSGMISFGLSPPESALKSREKKPRLPAIHFPRRTKTAPLCIAGIAIQNGTVYLLSFTYVRGWTYARSPTFPGVRYEFPRPSKGPASTRTSSRCGTPSSSE